MIDAIRKEDSNRKIERTVNSSLEEMKAVYFAKKGAADSRHNTTERNGTFYNMKVNKI